MAYGYAETRKNPRTKKWETTLTVAPLEPGFTLYGEAICRQNPPGTASIALKAEVKAVKVAQEIWEITVGGEVAALAEAFTSRDGLRCMSGRGRNGFECDFLVFELADNGKKGGWYDKGYRAYLMAAWPATPEEIARAKAEGQR